MFPKEIDKVKVPPIKIQGIKTKLVPFIAKNIKWDGKGTYFEPFMGSGVVGFNLVPQKAVFSDTNPYIIQFYQDIQSGKINHLIVRDFLEKEGEKLAKTPKDKTSYYYIVRDRFNKKHSSLDFLFLQRCNFNGMIRFNNKGNYNTPFGRKPERFQKAYITKIVNQVKWIEELMKGKDWIFVCKPFDEILKTVKENDFVYLDPPYINRYDTYFEPWSQEQSMLLAKITQESNVGYAFSMWLENEYRRNPYIDEWKQGYLMKIEHFYYLGGKKENRNKITEALIVNYKNKC